MKSVDGLKTFFNMSLIEIIVDLSKKFFSSNRLKSKIIRKKYQPNHVIGKD